ncbi:hypothetical protein HN51_001689 [Arachis hypogaea]
MCVARAFPFEPLFAFLCHRLRRHRLPSRFYKTTSLIAHSAALTITNGVRRAAIEEAKARHSPGILTTTPPPLAPPPQSSQTLARPPTPPPPPLSQDEVVTKQRNKDEVRTMFESYRRIKLFLSKKEGDFIHDLEQSFFALVNACRGIKQSYCKLARGFSKLFQIVQARYEAKNLLNGIPDSIGGLSRLIRLDLHQNSVLFEQGVNGFLFLLSSSCLKASVSVLCRNLINPFINHGLSFTCRDLFGVKILTY